MRKSIVAMLVAIAELLAWNAADAGEVLWSCTDNTDRYIGVIGSASCSADGEWFPLINSVYSEERGSRGQDYVFDSLYVTVAAKLSLNYTTQDSINFDVYLQTSDDKSTVSKDSIYVFRVDNFVTTYASGASLFGGAISRSVFSPTGHSPNVALGRYGRLLFSKFPATDGGGDSVTIDTYTIRAVGTSR